jgi:AAA15 family ATPase/GTPase
MLLEFRFQNFKSFKDDATLSLVASSDKSMPDNLLACPDDKTINLLSSVGIYGANASGKSTVFEAFRFVRNFVRNSAKNSPDDFIDIKPFLFDDETKSAPSLFEFTFIQEGVRYQYGFAATAGAIQREWLLSYPKGRPRNLFERLLKVDSDEYSYEFKFGSFLKGEKEKLIELTHPSALFLSVGSTFNNPQLLQVYRWFVDNIRYIQSSDLPESQMFSLIAKNPTLTDDVKRLIKFADLGIDDFSLIERELELMKVSPQDSESMKKLAEALNALVEERAKESLDFDKKVYNAKMTHRSGLKLVALPWNDESDGTRRLFSMSATIFETLNQGKIIFIDEIDRSLHPLLVRELIRLFQNPKSNPKGAQLIFNTHDTSLLSAGIFRRDQVWFLEKDQIGASHLYSLLEYSPRKDESLEKGYLQGRYGAIPFFGDYSLGGN